MEVLFICKSTLLLFFFLPAALNGVLFCFFNIKVSIEFQSKHIEQTCLASVPARPQALIMMDY